jgi:4-hydroxy-tetrahydrodipicolinate synthase
LNLRKGQDEVDFGRVLTAMITTFNQEGELDLQRQTKVINHLLETGTETIVVAGTTGESPTLSKEEKIKLFEHTVAISRGKGKVIAGTGSNNTKESILLTQQAEAAGVDGIMLVNPYYNKPNQEGLYQHFKAIAENTTLPVMLYNIPGRSAVNMSVETICRLAQIPNITMLKEANGDLGHMTEVINNTPDDFILYSGDDNLTLPVLAIGGYGIVSVAAHVLGKEMSRMVQLFIDGQVKEASKLHQDLYKKCNALFSSPSPVPVKRVLEYSGIEVGPVRLPLVSLTESEEEFILSNFR